LENFRDNLCVYQPKQATVHNFGGFTGFNLLALHRTMLLFWYHQGVGLCHDDEKNFEFLDYFEYSVEQSMMEQWSPVMKQWMTWLYNVLSVCNGIVQRCHHTRHGVYQAEDNNRVALLVWKNIILYLDSLEEPISGLEWITTIYDTINITYIKYHSNINYVTSIDVSDLFLTNTVLMGYSESFDQPPNSDPGGHRRAQLTFQSPAQVQHVTTTTVPTDQSAPSALEQFQSTILNQMMEMQKEIKSLRVSVETRDDIIQELRKEISSTKLTSATPVPSVKLIVTYPVAYPSAKVDSYSKQLDQDYMLRAFSTRDTPAIYPIEIQAAIPMDTFFFLLGYTMDVVFRLLSLIRPR